jgi:hypothetical protein
LSINDTSTVIHQNMSSHQLNLGQLERTGSRNPLKRPQVIRVLWPSHCQDSAGWIIGWSISDCISVATVIPDDEIRLPYETRGGRSGSFEKISSVPETMRVDTDSVEKYDYSSGEEDEVIVEVQDAVKHPKQLVQKVELLNQDFAKSYWRTELQILGFYDPTNSILKRIRGYGFGAVKETNSTRPQMLFVDGRTDLVRPQQIVLYDQPRQNEMYCDMFEWKKATPKTTQPKLAYLARTQPSTGAHSMYMASLHQINTSRSVEWMLKSPSSPLSKEMTKEAALRAFEGVHSHYQPVLWLIARAQVAMLTSVMWLLQLVHWVLNRRIPVLGRLAEYGLMGGFLDKRLVILLNFRDQVERMKSMTYTWQNDPTVQRAWLRFYNTSLSMLVDSLLGLVAAYVLWTILSPVGFFHAEITSNMTTLWGYEWLNAQIKWIMVGAPAGLKLNLATVQALGSIFLFYIEQWSVIVRHLAQAAPVVLVLITLSGAFFGLSMLIILVHDVVYFVNMHIYWLYAAITRVYQLQLSLLRSLWLLFRGKKKNVLKQRIDSCNASLDQLVVGTLLFTSLIFLLPTTALYYAFFVYAMCLVLLMQAVALIIVNILNYSPIYSLLLYCTRSRTLTGGIHFNSLNATIRLATSTSTTSLVVLGDLRSSTPGGSPRTHSTYFKLCSTFISLSVILSDFKKAMAVVAANYQLSKLIDCFLFGTTWQNKRFQPKRLKPAAAVVQQTAPKQ